MRICELFPVRERECLAATLDDFVAVLVDDVEGVAGERPHFLFHAEDGLFRDAVGGVHAQRGREWLELHGRHVGWFGTLEFELSCCMDAWVFKLSNASFDAFSWELKLELIYVSHATTLSAKQYCAIICLPLIGKVLRARMRGACL